MATQVRKVPQDLPMDQLGQQDQLEFLVQLVRKDNKVVKVFPAA
jgi:hypothetical protein